MDKGKFKHTTFEKGMPDRQLYTVKWMGCNSGCCSIHSSLLFALWYRLMQHNPFTHSLFVEGNPTKWLESPHMSLLAFKIYWGHLSLSLTHSQVCLVRK